MPVSLILSLPLRHVHTATAFEEAKGSVTINRMAEPQLGGRNFGPSSASSSFSILTLRANIHFFALAPFVDNGARYENGGVRSNADPDQEGKREVMDHFSPEEK
jgi:hypothetical protein